MKRMRAGLLALLLAGMAVAPGAVAADPAGRSRGQTLYVPVYSSVLHGNQDRSGNPGEWLLSVMVSLRNTDPRLPVRITAARYYDGAGTLLREYVTEPKTLAPLASMATFIENRDTAGGSGGSLVVTWEAEGAASPLLVEALHTDLFGTRSISFVSRGEVIAPDGKAP
ncbi:DUF3124 domain-containing protein [Novispirillum itersonii]|nr:DUF3124 domain-containing protein [Novispirillum itersonii]